MRPRLSFRDKAYLLFLAFSAAGCFAGALVMWRKV